MFLTLSPQVNGLSVLGGLDYWNGLLEWATGMDFDLFCFSQELTIIH